MVYILSVEASKYLEAILDYFLQYNIDAGEKFVQNFNNKCRNIAKFPKIGRSYGNMDSALRGIPIVRVVNGHRDLESLFLDLNR